MGEIQSAAQHVCRGCLEANLTEEIKISHCSKCSIIYCIHFASNIDPHYCTSCLSDVSVTKEVVVKTYQHYNEETDEVTEYKRKARAIKIEGMDWLFAQRKIITLSDDELELAIEYHRAILNGMLQEREDRRTKKAHRFAGIVIPNTSSTSTTTVKKTKTLSSNKAQAQMASIMQAMLASGKSMDEILKAMEGAIKK